jgi:hypothetical protein
MHKAARTEPAIARGFDDPNWARVSVRNRYDQTRDIERSLDTEIETLSAPASWVVRLHRGYHLKAARDRLDAAVAESGLDLGSLAPEDRLELIAPIVRETVSPYRNWLTMKAGAVGVGGSAAIGALLYCLPPSIGAALGVVFGVLSAPLLLPISQRICAPIARWCGADSEVQAKDTPFLNGLVRIAMRKTALLKPTAFEGRNIRSESFVQTMLAAFMAAQMIPEQEKAYEAIALVVINFAKSFQEVEVDATWSGLAQLILHDRFGNEEAYGAILAIIEREAAKEHLKVDELERILSKMIGPPNA